MKNRRFYLLSVLVILFITVCSCGDDREKLPYISNSITFLSSENTRPTFSSQGGTVSLSFTAAEDWAANLTNTRGDNWITVNPTSGSKGETQITITTTANETFDNRSTKVVLKCGTDADTLFISQLAKGAIIIAEKEYQFSKEGGELNLKVQSNLELEVTTSEPWIEQIQPTTRNLTEYELKFNIWPISVEHDQQGTITIKDKASDQQQIIVIKQIFVDSLTREALIAFYKATNGDHWINNTNWCSDAPYKEWYGVKTSILGIINISLSANGLSGTLPEEIGNIKDLAQLDLSDNKISGEIPNSIGETKLMALYLNKNNLSGEIPEGIGKLKNLMYLSLGNNSLSGSIPKSIGNLTKLEEFNLENNKLTGTIPTEIGNLKSLETFDIGNYSISAAGDTIIINPETGEVIGAIKTQNLISGTIPVELCKLPNLRMLYMGRNKLSGKIPEEIWSIPSLTHLDLSQNLLTGQISSNIRNVKKLKQLSLSNNLLTGSLPDEICELSNLEELSLANTTHKIVDGWMVENTENNYITGVLPENIGNLRNLKILSIDNLGLTGELPKSIWKCESLEELSIANGAGKYSNTLTGIIPEEIANLKKLYSFIITANKFTGTIPESITKLTNLGVIAIDRNNLEGPIPEGIGDLKKLKVFWASDNNLIGNIPIGFADLPNLQSLLLNGNRLRGVVPRGIIQLASRWEKFSIEKSILQQQEGYGLTINSERKRNNIQKAFMRTDTKIISGGYQIESQIVFETEYGKGSVAITKDR